jgi:hypothetical protein
MQRARKREWAGGRSMPATSDEEGIHVLILDAIGSRLAGSGARGQLLSWDETWRNHPDELWGLPYLIQASCRANAGTLV